MTHPTAASKPLHCAACDAELFIGDAIVDLSPGKIRRYEGRLVTDPDRDDGEPYVVCRRHLDDLLDEVLRNQPDYCEHRWGPRRSYGDSPVFSRCYDCGIEAES